MQVSPHCMRLFSIQPRFIYNALVTEGRFSSQPMKAGDAWDFADSPLAAFAYDWLCREMQVRGLVKPPGDKIYPIWAWKQYPGRAKSKPGLRSEGMKHWGREERHVLLTLEVPDHDVLLHDYEAWHYPLNHWYLGAPKAGDDFERRCARAGCPLHSAMPINVPALRAELEASWCSIFDLDAVGRLMGASAGDTQMIQATFWELRAEHVVSAVEFGLRRPKQTLALPIGRHYADMSDESARSSLNGEEYFAR